ncbi:hypothetical protein [Namhaeicola litoreus]|uniref:Outer membrane protein beta-barrel domain-containing protein n=1 Tax=Namhaeicola litoreus TaxID=1052145 RepID=A0ABW3Y1N6_9FLAO
MKNYGIICLFVFLFSSTNYLLAQENEQLKEEELHNSKFEKYHKEEEESKHSVSFVMGHAHISTAVKDGKDNEWITIPSFGLHYNYAINEKWGLGIHSELLLEVFEIAAPRSLEDVEELSIETIERNKPFSLALMGMYEVHHHLILLFGAGGEFSSEENFALIRLGVDVPIIEKFGWEAFATANFDFNIDAYNSFNLGLGIAKLF